MRILVIGDGGWGTALATLLSLKGSDVALWSAFPDYAAQLARLRENVKFLPGVAIPEKVSIVSRESGRLGSFDLAVSAYPTQFLRGVLRDVKEQLDRIPPVASGTKGVEKDTLARPTEIIAEELAPAKVAVFSGPSHAEEVARGLPTTVVAASPDPGFAVDVQRTLTTERFRVYTSEDVVGVELAGALKNVIAIAAGVCDGLGFGDNSKAALLTRGLVEIARLGAAMGAKRATFAGLAGMGDLITTCYSPFGRNLAVGRRVGKGEKLRDILAHMEMVAEGVATTVSARALARRHNVVMPITEEVYRVLFEDKPPKLAVSDLMTRGLRPEEDA